MKTHFLLSQNSEVEAGGSSAQVQPGLHNKFLSFKEKETNKGY